MFCLQIKEPWVMPNTLGNRSMPVHTYRWKDKACCEEKEPLEELAQQLRETGLKARIEKRGDNNGKTKN